MPLLTGGTLIQTPLIGADGRVYAVAQGPVNNNALHWAQTMLP